MALSNYEKETIISFNEDESTAVVFTYNRALINRMERLCKERPEECRPDPSNQITEEGRQYVVPKKWVKVSPPHTRNLSPEQQEALARRLAEYRDAKTRQD